MGAPQARLSDLAGRLKDLGHDVRVLTALPNYPTGRILKGYPRFYIREKRDGMHVWRCWILPTIRSSLFHRLVCYLSFCLSSLVVGLVQSPRADVIITESPPLFLAVSGWLLATSKKARWILNVSDLWPDSAKYIGMVREGSLTYRVLQCLAHFLYRQAWLVTGQSKEIVEEIQNQVPSVQPYHLSNGVDTQFFQPKHREEKIRQRYLKDGEVAFVYAGLHGLFQGLEQVLRAAERLRKDRVRFILFGDGPDKDTLVKKVQGLGLDNTDLYPPVPHKQIPPILASMDVAVVPLKSRIRGAVPSKIYEAMASGIPILLLADGEAMEIVREARAGVTVNPGDIDGLVSAVRRLASQSGWRREIGEAGRLAALKRYDRLTIAKKFEAVLRKGERGLV
jgi:glycosyltransferase involved in cell wall biosynthesis